MEQYLKENNLTRTLAVLQVCLLFLCGFVGGDEHHTEHRGQHRVLHLRDRQRALGHGAEGDSAVEAAIEEAYRAL